MTSAIDRDLVRLHKHRSQSTAVPDGALAILVSRRNAVSAALGRLCAEASSIEAAADAVVACLRSGGRVLVAGNGGSASEAQHFATELVGRFLRERAPYAVLSLTADTAVLTAIANDYGYEHVFARQVEAYGRRGDLFLGFSTSGRSSNLVNAATVARDMGVMVIAITGARQSPLADLADVAIRAPAEETPLIQELHTIVLHILCDLVESALAEPDLDRVVAVR